MFVIAKPKIKLPRLVGEVTPDFYAEDYYLGEGKSNWEKPYDWINFGTMFIKWAAFLLTGFPEAKSFINVGCARGFLEKAFLYLAERNKRTDLSFDGFDISPWAIENAEPEAKPFISVASVDDYHFTRQYDVMISLDTFEHLTEAQATRFILRSRKFVNDCGFFVIALDEERQRYEPSHVNLQDRAWWERKFVECGWVSDWQTQIMETLARKERFIQSCKVDVFIFRSQGENGKWIETPYDGKLLELARLDNWETPKGNGND